MQGELITVSLILGIQVLRAKDSAETVKLIAYVARQIKTMARGGCLPAGGIGRKINGKNGCYLIVHYVMRKR